MFFPHRLTHYIPTSLSDVASLPSCRCLACLLPIPSFAVSYLSFLFLLPSRLRLRLVLGDLLPHRPPCYPCLILDRCTALGIWGFLLRLTRCMWSFGFRRCPRSFHPRTPVVYPAFRYLLFDFFLPVISPPPHGIMTDCGAI